MPVNNSITPLAPQRRWFEDFAEGDVFTFGEYLVTEEEITEFARKYDPQPFHIDANAAKSSSFGGLVASGWMTGSILMRMMCDHFICAESAMGSPGLDNVRWLHPVRPGDCLHARVTVLEIRRSRSKPDRGSITHRQEAINQNGTVVMSLQGIALYRSRPAL